MALFVFACGLLWWQRGAAASDVHSRERNADSSSDRGARGLRSPPPARERVEAWMPLGNGSLRQPSMLYASSYKRHDTAEFVERALRAGFLGVDTATGEGGRYNDSGVGEALRRAFAGQPRSAFYVQLKVHHVASPPKKQHRHHHGGGDSATSSHSGDGGEGVSGGVSGFLRSIKTALRGGRRMLADTEARRTRAAEASAEAVGEAEAAAARVEASFTQGLARLGVSYVDAVLLRGPSVSALATGTLSQADVGAWRAVSRLVSQGRALSAGVCHMRPQLIEQLLALGLEPPRLLQVKVKHSSGFARREREYCAKRGLTLQAEAPVTSNRELFSERDRQTALHRLARARHVSPQQLLLRLMMQLGIVPLVGTTSALHLRDDLAALHFSGQQLSSSDLRELLKQPNDLARRRPEKSSSSSSTSSRRTRSRSPEAADKARRPTPPRAADSHAAIAAHSERPEPRRSKKHRRAPEATP